MLYIVDSSTRVGMQAAEMLSQITGNMFLVENGVMLSRRLIDSGVVVIVGGANIPSSFLRILPNIGNKRESDMEDRKIITPEWAKNAPNLVAIRPVPNKGIHVGRRADCFKEALRQLHLRYARPLVQSIPKAVRSPEEWETGHLARHRRELRSASK
jgi:hypothetical protein